MFGKGGSATPLYKDFSRPKVGGARLLRLDISMKNAFFFKRKQ